jgi:hypothetical protein
VHADAALRDEIRRLEERLLDPRVRASRDELARLLAPEFVEFGSSGRVFDRDAVIAALAGEPDVAFALSDLHVRELAAGVVLATYRVTAGRDAPQSSLRSSLWVRRAKRWQILFHQGTPTRSEETRPKETS